MLLGSNYIYLFYTIFNAANKEKKKPPEQEVKRGYQNATSIFLLILWQCQNERKKIEKKFCGPNEPFAEWNAKCIQNQQQQR